MLAEEKPEIAEDSEIEERLEWSKVGDMPERPLRNKPEPHTNYIFNWSNYEKEILATKMELPKINKNKGRKLQKNNIVCNIFFFTKIKNNFKK